MSLQEARACVAMGIFSEGQGFFFFFRWKCNYFKSCLVNDISNKENKRHREKSQSHKKEKILSKMTGESQGEERCRLEVNSLSLPPIVLSLSFRFPSLIAPVGGVDRSGWWKDDSLSSQQEFSVLILLSFLLWPLISLFFTTPPVSIILFHHLISSVKR